MFNNLKLTLLTEGQLCGNLYEDQLEVLEKYGTRSAISDLAILTGVHFSDRNMVSDDDTLKGREGVFYTKSSSDHGGVYCGNDVWQWTLSLYDEEKRTGAIRPVLVSSFIFSKISQNRVRGYNGTEEVEYGEYPQYAPDKSIQERLESEYQNKRLQSTGKNYTFDKTAYNDYSQGFQPVKYEEYEYNGKKYIRVRANYSFDYKKLILSNGIEYRNGDYVWVEVSPIKWLIDDKTKTLISKIGLLSGIRFHTDKYKYNGNFSTTEMKRYLDRYMSKEIVPSKTRLEVNKKASEKGLKNEKENQEEKQKTNQKELSDIEQLINEIIMQIEDFPNKELIVNEINALVIEYNNKIDMLNNNNSILKFDSLDSLKRSLLVKLSIILDRVKLFCEENNKYLELLGYIDKALLCINGKNVEDDNQLLIDLKSIGEVSLPFLKEENRKEIQDKFSKLLLDEKDKIMKYLDDILMDKAKTEKPQYKTKEELEIYIRTKMHPLLIELSNAVVKRDLQTEINSKFTGIMNGKYEETKNKRISFYLNEINNTFNKIVNLSNSFSDDRSSKYINKAKEIMKKEIDYTKSAEEINKEVVMILISLYGILSDIESELEYINEFKDSYVNVSL